jgi:peptidoglycan LD-endopeptidase CwlK
MPHFSTVSKRRLASCHPYLQEIATRAIEVMDFSIDCGHRSQVDQERAVREGASKANYPYSLHNANPSQAIDVAPWLAKRPHRPLNLYYARESALWGKLAGVILTIAADVAKSRPEWERFSLIWGADWNDDGDTRDTNLLDLGHFEMEIN